MNYILMADIVGSRRKKSTQLLAQFHLVVEDANKKFKKHLLSPLTITLGDEFQGIVTDLAASVAVIIYLEESRVTKGYNFQLRYVLHYGKVETAINKKNAHAMLGKGLTEARQALTALKTDKRNRFLWM